MLLVLGIVAGLAQAQDLAVPHSFSLGDRLSVVLTPDWVERKNEDPPPGNLLAASAPRILFSDILVLENRIAHAVLKVGISENPFLGSHAASLEEQMRAGNGRGLAHHLFYFFFPPPRACLARAKTNKKGRVAAPERVACVRKRTALGER